MVQYVSGMEEEVREAAAERDRIEEARAAGYKAGALDALRYGREIPPNGTANWSRGELFDHAIAHVEATGHLPHDPLHPLPRVRPLEGATSQAAEEGVRPD